jgi:hypothetical protein
MYMCMYMYMENWNWDMEIVYVYRNEMNGEKRIVPACILHCKTKERKDYSFIPLHFELHILVVKNIQCLLEKRGSLLIL